MTKKTDLLMDVIVSNASEEQKAVLLRRLGGYHPTIKEFREDDLMLINLNRILDF